MRQVILLSVAVALAFACANSTSGGAVLDPNLLGTWNGQSQLAVTGVATYTAVSAEVVVLSVSGNTATLLDCNNGTVTFTGSGDTATWSGSLTCPPTDVATCGEFTTNPTNNNLALVNNVLMLTITGNVTYGGTGGYCGKTYPFTREFFDGVKDAGS